MRQTFPAAMPPGACGRPATACAAPKPWPRTPAPTPGSSSAEANPSGRRTSPAGSWSSPSTRASDSSAWRGREPLTADVGRQEHGAEGGRQPVPVEERVEAPVGVELAVEAREALRALAGLRWRRRRVLALRAAGYSYKEIAAKLGVTYTNVNRHVTEGRGELRELRDAA